MCVRGGGAKLSTGGQRLTFDTCVSLIRCLSHIWPGQRMHARVPVEGIELNLKCTLKLDLNRSRVTLLSLFLWTDFCRAEVRRGSVWVCGRWL